MTMLYYEQNTGSIAYTGRPNTSTTDENIEAVKKAFESLLERLLIMLAYRSAHAKQFLQMF